MHTVMLLLNKLFRPAAVSILILAVPQLAHAELQAVRGITEPYHDVTLSVTVPGTVTQVLKKEGESVRAGEDILELDKDLETLEVERRRVIMQSTVELEEARQKLATYTRLVHSAQELYTTTHSVSENDLLQRELEAKLAALEVQRLEDVGQRQKIEYEMAQAQLDRRTVTAPFNGIIVKLFVYLGDECNPQAPVARIVDVSKCRLIVHVDAVASFGLTKGTAVRVSVPGLPSGASEGVVDFVSPVVDPSSCLREIKVLFDNPGGKVLPGVTGTVLLPLKGQAQ
jgi:RND family efflux transporter MFP subunit